MGLNSTPTANRIHIGIFGRRNAGKSSVINAITAQNLAIVSNVLGTTTDPVYKSMELLPLGPVTIIDTPGIDDEGELGQMRIKKSYQVLHKTDIALVIIDSSIGITSEDKKIIERIKAHNIPYILVYNKSDIKTLDFTDSNAIAVSTKTGKNINELKELIAKQINTEQNQKQLVSDLVKPNDFVVLVIPIDSSAPKGRLILPQQQVIRDLLEAGAVTVAVKDTELKSTLDSLRDRVKLVITDSQAFKTVSKIVPEDILLTSFSILFSRFKGNLETTVLGAKAIDLLQDSDTVLISEGCTHHRQCEDIGTVKLPNWIKKHTGKDIKFEFTSGTEFPDYLTDYKLIVHCGGCTLNEREMKYRLNCATEQNIPITNYGTLIAYINGILKRSIKVFPDIYNKL